MANGFWNFLKKTHDAKKDTQNENSENFINNNPTEEQLKDNKNGNIAVVLSVIASILLIAIVAMIVFAFSSNVGIGIISICLLIIPSILQMNAIKKAKKQLNINGKGKIKFLLVKFIFPTIAAIASIVILFVLIGLNMK